MRKMTYQEAATCGENLKVRVTTEQSVKMQKAWFEAGKTWLNGSTEILIYEDDYLILKDFMSRCAHNDNKEEIIELIDDPQHDFASQQEVTLWVAQGNKVQFITSEVVGFKDGVLWNFSKNQKSDYCFCEPSHWQKHTPPRLIRVNGVEVPAPLDSLDELDFVWAACTSGCFGLSTTGSNQANFDLLNNLLSLRLLYATAEDAIKRAEAILKFEVVE